MSAVMPERPTLAGDWKDDDGQVFADLVEPQANPLPVPDQVMVEPVTQRPPRPGRLMCGSMTADPTWPPMLVLPADPDRKSVTIQNNSATATDSIRVADESGKLQNLVGGGLVFPANPLTLLGYTGPVWLSASQAVAPVSVSYWAVTL